MTIALPTILAIVFIAPGAAFLLGLYSQARIGRFVSNTGIIATGSLTLVSLLIHAALISLIGLCQWIWSFKGGFTLRQYHLSEFSNYLYNDFGLNIFFLYLTFALFLSFCVGRCFMWLVVSGTVNTSFFHGALYPYYVGKEEPLNVCVVLSKVEFNEKKLLYYGFIEDIGISRGSKIDYIVLSEVERFLMCDNDVKLLAAYSDEDMLTGNFLRALSTPPVPISIPENSEYNSLFIDGEEIANAYITKSDFNDRIEEDDDDFDLDAFMAFMREEEMRLQTNQLDLFYDYLKNIDDTKSEGKYFS